jgi:hypothetical protein
LWTKVAVSLPLLQMPPFHPRYLWKYLIHHQIVEHGQKPKQTYLISAVWAV